MKDSLETIKDIKFDEDSMQITIEAIAPKNKDIKAIKTLDGEKLVKILKVAVKESKKHFKEDGWSIDKDAIVADVMYDLFGFHLDEIISHTIAAKTGSELVYGKGRPVFNKIGGYSPVYYDTFTGEIIIIDNPENKEYIFKYSEINGYESLGCL